MGRAWQPTSFLQVILNCKGCKWFCTNSSFSFAAQLAYFPLFSRRIATKPPSIFEAMAHRTIALSWEHFITHQNSYFLATNMNVPLYNYALELDLTINNALKVLTMLMHNVRN